MTTLVSSLLSVAASASVQGSLTTASAAEPLSVQLEWLEAPSSPGGQAVSWGVPFAQGAVPKDSRFALTDAAGRALPLQSWPLAYWPDGTLKWNGFSSVVPPGTAGGFKLVANGGASASARDLDGSVRVRDEAEAITVDTGALVCRIPRTASALIESMTINGRTVAGNGRLTGILQQGPTTHPENSPPKATFSSRVRNVIVEQSGPVRAVVKIEGDHEVAESDRTWLPFSVRLYFHTGETSVRVVHTIIFDGDQEQDFVRGLGLEFDVPMREEPQNRHVRFVGAEGGLWAEPLQPGGGSVEQETGQPFTGRRGFSKNAIWDDFKLVQPNPHGFSIVKRTNPQSTWLFSAAGTRAAGFAFVGDLSGGLGVSVKDFWQSYPSSLEVRRASSETATLIAWLWSPDGPEMDMRHYDIVAHGLLASYEDVQPGMSTAHGVARTSELTLFPTSSVPSRENVVAMGQNATRRALLVASPHYTHSTGVFGVWSVPDRSTPFKKAIEDGLDSVLAFYERQVDDHDWYGFWQYGDFMHSYSAPRHKWHYDWGGHAWDNTELASPLWLWYSFLRTGRADVFRLAEAMTRNTSETIVYHIGDLAGLGSRHNVIKWGDGAKEVRISQSAHWRPFYYITTDERTGDIMRAMSTQADRAIARWDPMRIAAPPVPGEPEVPVRIRIGPDWFALAGNWMTEWERTADVRWRDRILAGVDSIVNMPYWLQTGQMHGLNPDLPGGGVGPLKGGGAQMVGLDLETGELTALRDPVEKKPVPVSYNLATIQGGAEVMFELVPLLGREDFERAWLQYCRIGQAPADVLERDQQTGNEGSDASYVLTGQSGPRLAAYAYAKTKEPAFATRAIEGMLNQGGGAANPRRLSGPDTLNAVVEDPRMSTNGAAQTGLTTIQILELCKDALPHEAPERIGPPPRRR